MTTGLGIDEEGHFKKDNLYFAAKSNRFTNVEVCIAALFHYPLAAVFLF